jgi:hypothetical protein
MSKKIPGKLCRAFFAHADYVPRDGLSVLCMLSQILMLQKSKKVSLLTKPLSDRIDNIQRSCEPYDELGSWGPSVGFDTRTSAQGSLCNTP